MNRFTSNTVTAFALLASVAASSPAANASIVVALSGAAPAGGNYNGVFTPRLSSAGQVAFSAS